MSYMEKYLKYKSKYMNLKNELNISKNYQLKGGAVLQLLDEPIEIRLQHSAQHGLIDTSAEGAVQNSNVYRMRFVDDESSNRLIATLIILRYRPEGMRDHRVIWANPNNTYGYTDDAVYRAGLRVIDEIMIAEDEMED